MLKLAKYKQASQLETAGKYEEAKAIYKELGTYEDSMAKVSSCTYNIAITLLDSGKFDDAKAVFETITDYADSKDKVTECDYQKAVTLVAEKKYRDAIKIFKALGDYSESKAKILDAKYKYVNDHLSKDDKITVKYLEDLIEERYLDSAVIRRKLLGATALTDGVSSCINYDKEDFTTDLTEVENSKQFYFHITVADAELYGKRLTAKFTTSVGYTERKSVTFTEGDNTYSLTYPRTSVSDYSVEFSLVAADGTELVKQTVDIK
jgi:tetratricopeptide (TPR) repeat protein